MLCPFCSAFSLDLISKGPFWAQGAALDLSLSCRVSNLPTLARSVETPPATAHFLPKLHLCQVDLSKCQADSVRFQKIPVDMLKFCFDLLWFSSSRANCSAHSRGSYIDHTRNMRYYSSKIQPCFLSFMSELVSNYISEMPLRLLISKYLICVLRRVSSFHSFHPSMPHLNTWSWAPHASGLASWGTAERGTAPGGPGVVSSVAIHWCQPLESLESLEHHKLIVGFKRVQSKWIASKSARWRLDEVAWMGWSHSGMIGAVTSTILCLGNTHFEQPCNVGVMHDYMEKHGKCEFNGK